MSDTWGTIKEEISNEYDLSEEVFVNADGLLAWANAGLADIEKEIHSIPDRDKYFQTEEDPYLNEGQSDYDLPSNIFANKIIAIWYNDGSKYYEIKPIKKLEEIQDVQDTDLYRYRIINRGDGRKIRLYPTPTSSGDFLRVHYIRQVIRFSADVSELDVPEGKNFLKQYIMDKAANKERMTPDAPESPALKRERDLLIQVLENMTADDNNEVEADLSFYDDCV